jgi:hypothetical protein
MSHTEEELANAVMSKLYDHVAKVLGDVTDGSQDDPFICWCKPGLPCSPEDFRFAQFLVNGQGATNEERINDLAKQKIQSAAFSVLVDFVPSVNGIIGGEDKDGTFRPSSEPLSKIYKKMLEVSDVAELPQPEGIDEKIAALQAQAAPLQESYDKFSEEYDIARANFVTKRNEASYSAEALLKFEAEGPIAEKKMNRARDNWEISGNKTKYENITAEIQSLRIKRSPAIWLKEAVEIYEKMASENTALGKFFPVYPMPGSFAQNMAGWQEISIETSHIDTLNQQKSSKYAVDGKIGWGSLGIDGGASGSTTSELTVKNTDNFSLKLKITQVSLIRPWFDPWFLKSPFWRIKPSSMEGQAGKVVSDGGDGEISPPKGELIAYPVMAIFVSDVAIKMDEFKDENSNFVTNFKASGGGKWGFGVFSTTFNREKSAQTTTSDIDHATGEMKMSGMNLIGYVCEMTGKAPNPKDGLKWVGEGE